MFIFLSLNEFYFFADVDSMIDNIQNINMQYQYLFNSLSVENFFFLLLRFSTVYFAVNINLSEQYGKWYDSNKQAKLTKNHFFLSKFMNIFI